MHTLMAAVLLWMAGRDAFEANAETQPPDGEFTQPVQRVRRRKGDPVIRPDRVVESASHASRYRLA
jgi:hypothetical protein